MNELSIEEQAIAKGLAMEVVLLALMRERRDDPTFWDRIERVMAEVLARTASQPYRNVPLMADAAQDFLDAWRDIAGSDPAKPAPPGTPPSAPR